MRFRILAVAGLAICTALAPGASGAGRNDAKNKAKAAKKKGAEKPRKNRRTKATGHLSLCDSLDKVAAVVSLKPKELARLEAMRNDRDEALVKWDQANAKVIARAREMRAKVGKRDKNKSRQIEQFLKQKDAQRARLAAMYDARMFRALTPEQRAKWNAHLILPETELEFAICLLLGDQQKKLEALCRSAGKRLGVPFDKRISSHQLLLTAVVEEVYFRVLDDQQRQDYASLKRSEKPRHRKSGQKRRGRDGRR